MTIVDPTLNQSLIHMSSHCCHSHHACMTLSHIHSLIKCTWATTTSISSSASWQPCERPWIPTRHLLIHAHWFYAPPDILMVAKAFESLNLMWLEDPIPPENIEAMLWQRSPDPPQPQSERARTSTHATVSGTSSSNRLRNHLPLPRKSRRISRGTPYRRSCGHVLHSVLTS